jgi:argininosuccinate synthase
MRARAVYLGTHPISSSLSRPLLAKVDLDPVDRSTKIEHLAATGLTKLGAIIEELNHRVGKFGSGRYSGPEHLDRGEKVLRVREMPAAWILLKTLRRVNGTVTWTLNQRSVGTVSICAQEPLYLRDHEDWEMESVQTEKEGYAVPSEELTLAGLNSV